MNTPPRSQARSAARLAAVQALYQQQMEGTALAWLLDEFHQHRLGRTVDDEDLGEVQYADAEIDFFNDIVRGVDALIWTVVLARAFGPGPLTGALAILITDTGTFGKIFSEALENVDE